MFRFDLQLFAQAPSGELVSMGIGKESSYGSAAVPSVFLIPTQEQFDGTNELLDRMGARKRVGRTEAMTGMFTGKGSMQIEVDPDTFGAVLALLMGGEAVAANLANPAALAVTTTLSAAVPMGWGAATPVSMTNIVVGQSLTVDTAGLVETVVVQAISATQFWAYFTKAHASGVAITNAAVVLAYDHTFTLASPRNSFTTQINEITAARNCVGGKFSQLQLNVQAQSVLEAALQVEYQTEAHVNSPVTPTYSTLPAFVFETTGNAVNVNGASADASIQGWSVDINTGLITKFPKYGNGRLRGQLPETFTKASGKIDLAFETETMRQAFWGLTGSTGPQSQVLAVPLAFTFVSNGFVNTAVPYELQVIIPKAKFVNASTPMRTNDYIKQTVQYEAYESTNGAGDDVKFVLTNAASGPSI